jgi:hypothetical protein
MSEEPGLTRSVLFRITPEMYAQLEELTAELNSGGGGKVSATLRHVVGVGLDAIRRDLGKVDAKGRAMLAKVDAHQKAVRARRFK